MLQGGTRVNYFFVTCYCLVGHSRMISVSPTVADGFKDHMSFPSDRHKITIHRMVLL